MDSDVHLSLFILLLSRVAASVSGVTWFEPKIYHLEDGCHSDLTDASKECLSEDREWPRSFGNPWCLCSVNIQKIEFHDILEFVIKYGCDNGICVDGHMNKRSHGGDLEMSYQRNGSRGHWVSGRWWWLGGVRDGSSYFDGNGGGGHGRGGGKTLELPMYFKYGDDIFDNVFGVVNSHSHSVNSMPNHDCDVLSLHRDSFRIQLFFCESSACPKSFLVLLNPDHRVVSILLAAFGFVLTYPLTDQLPAHTYWQFPFRSVS